MPLADALWLNLYAVCVAVGILAWSLSVWTIAKKYGGGK